MAYQLVANGTQKGPVSDEALQSLIAQGAISADTLCKRDEWQDWRAVAQVFPERFTQVRQTDLPTEPIADKPAAPSLEPEATHAAFYQEAVAVPHFKYKLSGFTWTLLGLLVVLVILGVSAVVISNH